MLGVFVAAVAAAAAVAAVAAAASMTLFVFLFLCFFLQPLLLLLQFLSKSFVFALQRIYFCLRCGIQL